MCGDGDTNGIFNMGHLTDAHYQISTLQLFGDFVIVETYRRLV